MTDAKCTCGRDLATHPPGACIDALGAEFADVEHWIHNNTCWCKSWSGETQAWCPSAGEEADWADAGRILEAAECWLLERIHVTASRCRLRAKGGFFHEARADSTTLAVTRAAAICVVARKAQEPTR